MKELLNMLTRCMDAGEDAVLVTIVAGSGSTPRGAGARMLVTAAGRLCGTIGGGAVEYKSQQIAAEILRDRGSKMETFRLYRNEVEDLGMVCGGDVDVYFRYVPHEDPAVKELLAQSRAVFAAREPSWLITELSGSGALSIFGERSGLLGAPVPRQVLDALEPRPCQITAGERTYYCEKLLQPGRVFIFGGGHIARALVPVLQSADFACVVLDDRPDFVRPEDFNGAETRCMDPADISEVAGELTEDDCVCIMTRGHKDDMLVQRQLMRTPAKYIGVIGSARKQQTVKAQILASGYTEADFKNVVSPIGLDIGAESPSEIAVSIAAQLIMVRAGKGPGPKDWKTDTGRV